MADPKETGGDDGKTKSWGGAMKAALMDSPLTPKRKRRQNDEEGGEKKHQIESAVEEWMSGAGSKRKSLKKEAKRDGSKHKKHGKSASIDGSSPLAVGTTASPTPKELSHSEESASPSDGEKSQKRRERRKARGGSKAALDGVASDNEQSPKSPRCPKSPDRHRKKDEEESPPRSSKSSENLLGKKARRRMSKTPPPEDEQDREKSKKKDKKKKRLSGSRQSGDLVAGEAQLGSSGEMDTDERPQETRKKGTPIIPKSAEVKKLKQGKSPRKLSQSVPLHESSEVQLKIEDTVAAWLGSADGGSKTKEKEKSTVSMIAGRVRRGTETSITAFIPKSKSKKSKSSAGDGDGSLSDGSKEELNVPHMVPLSPREQVVGDALQKEQPVRRRRSQSFDAIRSDVIVKEALSGPTYAPVTRTHPQFGLSLVELRALYPQSRVPPLIKSCIEYMQKHIEVEGIFRIPGRQTLIYELKVALEQGQPIPDDVAPFTVAGTISDFFRSLPEPLLTHELYMPFIQAAAIEDSEDTVVEGLRTVVELLPAPNYELAYDLIEFLAEVAAHEEANRMGSKNLSLVFGASLLDPPASHHIDVRMHAFNIKLQSLVVELMISRFHDVFRQRTMNTVVDVQKRRKLIIMSLAESTADLFAGLELGKDTIEEDREPGLQFASTIVQRDPARQSSSGRLQNAKMVTSPRSSDSPWGGSKISIKRRSKDGSASRTTSREAEDNVVAREASGDSDQDTSAVKKSPSKEGGSPGKESQSAFGSKGSSPRSSSSSKLTSPRGEETPWGGSKLSLKRSKKLSQASSLEIDGAASEYSDGSPQFPRDPSKSVTMQLEETNPTAGE